MIEPPLGPRFSSILEADKVESELMTMLKPALLATLVVATLIGTASAVPPWNRPARSTEVRQKIQQQQNDKPVKPPLKDTLESHYLMQNPDERHEYFSKRTIVTKPSKIGVPMTKSRDRDPDTGTYYYVPTRP